jgi:hypothetical protein
MVLSEQPHAHHYHYGFCDLWGSGILYLSRFMTFLVLGFNLFMVCELQRYKSTMHVTSFFFFFFFFLGSIEGLSDPIDCNDFLKKILNTIFNVCSMVFWHVYLFSKVYEVIHSWGSIRNV